MKKERYQTGTCEACGFTLVIDYHHPDGSKAVIDGLDWKMVPKNPENKMALCPICHRLIHRGLAISTVRQKVRKFWKDYWRGQLLGEMEQDLIRAGYGLHISSRGNFSIYEMPTTKTETDIDKRNIISREHNPPELDFPDTEGCGFHRTETKPFIIAFDSRSFPTKKEDDLE